MHAIEREIIKVTGYKAQRPFHNRQDYLKSLINATAKLSDDDFDNLSDEAAAWANAAVENTNSKNGEVPDFDEVVPPGADNDELSDDAENEDEASEETHDPETGEVTDEAPENDEVHEEAKPKSRSDKAKVGNKTIKSTPEKTKASEKTPKKPVSRKPTDDDEVILDKWGAMQGSKNSQALALFEKGATAKEVKDTLGGTYYNILKKAVENGHRMEKEGAMIKITHKDEMKSTKPVTKKKVK